MSRTTIDGLTARPSNSRRAPKKTTNNKAVRTSNGKFADVTPQKPTRRAKNVQTTDITRPAKTKVRVRKNVTPEDDFLSPVSGFNLGEPDNSLEASNDADWSSLLGDMTDDSQDEVGLDDWGDEPEDKKAEKLTRKEKKAAKKAKKAKKKHRILKKVLIGLLVLLLIGGVVFYFWGDAIISKLTGGRSGLWDTLVSFVSEEVPFETDANGRTNVLIFGTEGYDMNGAVGAGEHDGSQLTDSIMVASFDQETKDVALLSLPRDLKVPRACYAGKVNEIFTCNNPDGTAEEVGAQAMMEEIGEILGIDFQYWAHVNWSSLIDIINALGGITVTFDEDINDYGWTNAVAQAGVPITINGEQALGFARARHGTVGGDFSRGNTQQKIVEGIVNKVIDDGVGITEAFNLLNILGDNFRSNFSSDNIKAGVSLLSGFDMNNIRNVPLVDYDNNVYYVTTDTINGISYVVPSAGTSNYHELQAYVDKMFSSNPAVREGATIAVFNATEAGGVAGAEQAALENDGYTVMTIGDATAGSCEVKYCLYAMNDLAPATRAALEERYGVVAFGAEALPADIMANTDFVIVVGQAE